MLSSAVRARIAVPILESVLELRAVWALVQEIGWHGDCIQLVVRIETTAEMRRFNSAVERADQFLGNGSDRLDVPELVAALLFCDWNQPCGWPAAARELREAARAISPGMEPGE